MAGTLDEEVDHRDASTLPTSWIEAVLEILPRMVTALQFLSVI